MRLVVVPVEFRSRMRIIAACELLLAVLLIGFELVASSILHTRTAGTPNAVMICLGQVLLMSSGAPGRPHSKQVRHGIFFAALLNFTAWSHCVHSSIGYVAHAFGFFVGLVVWAAIFELLVRVNRAADPNAVTESWF